MSGALFSMKFSEWIVAKKKIASHMNLAIQYQNRNRTIRIPIKYLNIKNLNREGIGDCYSVLNESLRLRVLTGRRIKVRMERRWKWIERTRPIWSTHQRCSHNPRREENQGREQPFHLLNRVQYYTKPDLFRVHDISHA